MATVQEVQAVPERPHHREEGYGAGHRLPSVEPKDQSSLNRFLTVYGWDDERVNRRRIELLQSTRETQWSWDGVVSIDNTLLSKTGRKMPGEGRLWDYNSGS